MTNRLVVKVATQNSIYHIDNEYSYIIDENIIVGDITGYRVLVPFSRGNRTIQGYVLSSSFEDVEENQYKSVIEILDKEPFLSKEMVKMAYFIKDRYFCTLYDAIKAMLPVGINYDIKTIYLYNENYSGDIKLNQNQNILLNYIKQKSKVLKNNILKEFNFLSIEKDLKFLENIDAIKKDYHTKRKINDATLIIVKLLNYDKDIKITAKQQEVISVLKTHGEISLKEVCYYSNVTKSVCDTLVKNNIIEYISCDVLRIPQSIKGNQSNKEQISLTSEQNIAYEDLKNLYISPKPHVSLLYGVTGSGKTSVFMKLIDKVYEDGKNIILMVPEIALTTQMISLFTRRYGEDVAIFHSALSDGERLDEWKRVKNGQAKIAIGTRSAVFAPFSNLGLIIMDEEHEHTYKSETTPRYHAREVAKLRCVVNNCLLLLSSATPSVESFYKAKNGTYSINYLKNRYGNSILPDVMTADMNIELEQGNMTQFSSMLVKCLEDNIESGKQSILLMNRRGHNTFVVCRECKQVVNCPNCSISLTFHSANNKLMCHYCGYSQSVSGECSNCGSDKLSFRGAGTQKVEQTLATILPSAKILRIDADTTMAKQSHEKLFRKFKNGEYNIMIGTQMVAKGLNFPNVTLVGVLNADTMLFSDDYRCHEKAFSLLTQVVGRSGRGKYKGSAVIQTTVPENPIIGLATIQDYEQFYKSEIVIRKMLLYPPFSDICMIVFISDNDKFTYEASKRFTNLLCEIAKNEYNEIPLTVLGPSVAVVKKVSNKYRYKLVLKFKNSKRFREMISKILVEFAKDNKNKKITVYADINPNAIL